MSSSSDPRLGAIRLAWWREQLDALDADNEAPAEPRLRAVAQELLPRGVNGHELSKLEDAWLPLFEAFPWADEQADGLALRGRILFGIGARLLGCSAKAAASAGAFWSISDGTRHCSDPQSREFLRLRAGEMLPTLRERPAARLRPLTVLAALAAADLREGGGLARLSAAVRHRLTGGFPHS